MALPCGLRSLTFGVSFNQSWEKVARPSGRRGCLELLLDLALEAWWLELELELRCFLLLPPRWRGRGGRGRAAGELAGAVDAPLPRACPAENAVSPAGKAATCIAKVIAEVKAKVAMKPLPAKSPRGKSGWPGRCLCRSGSGVAWS